MADPQKKILVVDDEEDLTLLLAALFGRAGYDVVECGDGREAIRLFYSERPDLVVLDVAMPKMDGWDVIKRLREISDVPVLMLTARADASEIVKGLTGGADQYVTKPFSSDELLARVEAMLRRAAIAAPESKSNIYRDAEVSIDFPRHEIVVRGERVELSPTEFRLLSALTRNAGIVMSQDQILDQVWGREYSGSADLVRLYIGTLRKKIGDNHTDAPLIQTVRGFGYRYRKAN